MNHFELLTFILAGLGVVGAAIAIFFITRLERLRKGFFAGKNAGDLEKFILNQTKKINELHGQLDYVEEALKNLQLQQKFAIQKLGIIRYNPFQDDGGNLSFSMAILDDHDNGVVITSLHGRDANRTYAKPIKGGKSEFSLTAEENQAIDAAKKF